VTGKTGKTPRPARDPLAVAPAAPKRPLAERAKPRFHVEGHDDLDARDWQEIAEAYLELGPVQRDLTENPEPPPVERPSPDRPMPPRLAKVANAMERFRASAVDAPDERFKRGLLTDVSHPAFGANLIAATLDLVKMPLTEAQAARIGELAREATPVVDAADPPILPDDGSYRLDHIVAKAEAVDGFYYQAFSALTREQGEAVSPEKWRNRARTDPLSSGSMWTGIANLQPYAELPELVDRMTDGIMHHFHIQDRREELHAIVAAWAAELGYDPAEELELKQAPRTSRLTRDARRMTVLMRKVVGDLKLPPEAVEDARSEPSFYVPLQVSK
jgi:hypothetical protein